MELAADGFFDFFFGALIVLRKLFYRITRFVALRDHFGCQSGTDNYGSARGKRGIDHGVNARGVIVGHTTNQWGENAYMVEMTNDKGVLFVDWMKTGTIPAGAIAETNKQRHFKWNIEHHFVADDSTQMGS